MSTSLLKSFYTAWAHNNKLIKISYIDRRCLDLTLRGYFDKVLHIVQHLKHAHFKILKMYFWSVFAPVPIWSTYSFMAPLIRPPSPQVIKNDFACCCNVCLPQTSNDLIAQSVPGVEVAYAHQRQSDHIRPKWKICWQTAAPELLLMNVAVSLNPFHMFP